MIISDATALADYINSLPQEDDILRRARHRAAHLGYSVIPAATGTLLCSLSASSKARSIIEVGTGTGVSGIYLLRGAAAASKNVALTTIDSDVERVKAARHSFNEAGFLAAKTRIIDGDARQILPRMSETAYDLVFIRCAPRYFVDHFIEAYRIAKPGGIIVVSDVLRTHGESPPGNYRPETVTAHEFLEDIMANRNLMSTVVPTDNGVLVSVKNNADPPF